MVLSNMVLSNMVLSNMVLSNMVLTLLVNHGLNLIFKQLTRGLGLTFNLVDDPFHIERSGWVILVPGLMEI